MTPELSSAALYTDLQGLERVRRHADKDDSGESLRFAAQQFEALFLQMMLKSARESGLGDGLFDSEQTDFYRDLRDKQLAIDMARGQGIGIADLLVKQLGGDRHAEVAAGSEQGRAVAQIRRLRDYLDHRVKSPPPPMASSDQGVTAAVPTEPPLATPQDFVRTLWPQARAAADKLGVDPAVLLAQAALETGWGRAVSRHADGRSSHNLFNIKADARWPGERVGVDTLEFRNGTFARRRAQFRAYGSYAESFADYVDFLQNSTRYRPALAAADDGRRFVTELAQAGYATDPRYAEKILGIVAGEPMRQSLDAVVQKGNSFNDF